jgi:PAS domain S-box-containing protein
MKTYLESLVASNSDEQSDIRDWKILHQLSNKLLHPDSLERKLTHVLDTVAAFHGTSMAVISILEPMSPTFDVKASIGMNEAAVADLSRITPGEGCCGYAFSERRRVVVENFAQSEMFAGFLPWAQHNLIGAVYATPFYDAGGEPLGALSVYFDQPHAPTAREMELTDMCASTVALIVDRDRTESTLRTERDRRDNILRGMAEGLCIVNHDFIVIEMNAAALQFNQRPLHEMLGRSHWDLWPETTDSEVGRLYRKAMKERVRASLENRWEDPLGNVRWFDLTALPIDEGLALYIQDITERKKTEQSIADSEARYRALSESVSDVVWRCDANGMVVHELPSWARFSGQTWEEYSGKGWGSRIHPDDLDRVLAEWNQCMTTGTHFHVAHRVRRHDGIFRHMLARGVPLKNANGEIREWIGNGEDVTEMLAIQEQLQLADKRKDEFLAVLSHELRSPLSATKMAAQLLETPGITPDRSKQMGQVITRQVDHMSRLVEDLIDVSRVSRGLIRMERDRVDLHKVIQSAIEQVRPMITANGHTLNVTTAPGAEAITVVGDRTRLVQVIANLLCNAARYTPAGGHITIFSSVTDHTAHIKIVDNGVGLNPDMIENLFDLFVQAEISTDRKNGGLGLGLALVRSLVELHGGNVSASSDGEGLGSTFCVDLPLGSLNSKDAGNSRLD